MKIKVSELKRLIREAIYSVSAPEKYNLPEEEVEADDTREAGVKGSQLYAQKHGVRGIDPFSIDVNQKGNDVMEKELSFDEVKQKYPEAFEELERGCPEQGIRPEDGTFTLTPVDDNEFVPDYAIEVEPGFALQYHENTGAENVTLTWCSDPRGEGAGDHFWE